MNNHDDVFQRSPGQQRVRELASLLVPAYRRTTDWDKLDRLFIALRSILSQDRIVTTDPITAAPVGFGPYSMNYMDWLLAISRRSERDRFAPNIRLDKFVYRRSEIDERAPPPRYLGGAKWESTMQAILGIVAGEPMYRYDLEARYFAHSGILTIAGGGNHRLLAYVLTGEPGIEADSYEWCEETCEPDLTLNAALRTVEQLYPSTWRFHLDTFDLEHLEAKAHAVRIFVTESSTEERSVIAAYLSALERIDAPWHIRADMQSIAGLLRCLHELRELRGQRGIGRWFRRLQRQLGAAQPRSMFAQWYERYERAADRTTNNAAARGSRAD